MKSDAIIPVGARYDSVSRKCAFAVWAPLKEKMELLLPTENGKKKIYPMTKDGGGYWRAEADAPPGTRYLYRIDAQMERPDPASFYQPAGVHGPSEVTRRGLKHDETPREKFPRRKIRDMIISEIHIGTFTREGTFEAAARELSRLSEAGINTVEIMPVAQFPGKRNWGYDGAYPFAVQNSYGGPDGLRFFATRCHRLGLSVILDVVYNHLGPEGNYLGDFAPYFTHRYRTPWGAALNFDGAYSYGTRNYFAANALYWFEDFGIDALRLDAIHGIFDMSAKHILAELSETAEAASRKAGREFYLIAESDLNDSRVVRPPKEGGYDVHAQWSDDFHHAVHTLLTKENSGYYEDFGPAKDFADVYQKGVVYDGKWSAHRKRFHGNSYKGVEAGQFVVCAQNHDQVGNRLMGERLASIVDFESLKLAAACVFLSPFAPLFFMGDEYAEDAPFFYFVDHTDKKLIDAVRDGRAAEFASFGWKIPPPDPAAEETFVKSRLKPDATESDGRKRVFAAFFRKLASLRRGNPSFAADFATVKSVEVFSGTVAARRKSAKGGEFLLLFNFAENPSVFDKIKIRRGAKIFDTSDEKWSGPGSPQPGKYGADSAITLNPRSASVYRINR